MPTISQFSDKWVLIIDDQEGMRSQLRTSLSSAGFAKLHVASNIKDALERMAVNRYDVLLCDYSLGEGTDGQQFLEYLRTNDLIKRSTIFVMITAEQAYEKVVAASECAPDGYLLKPFTAAQFNARLEKLLEKQAYFSAIDSAADKKDWAQVVKECDKLLPAKNKYLFELCKIKGAALMRDNQAQQAANLYREVLALRPLNWAKLDLARALEKLGSKVEAENLVREILADAPQFMAAYDFLGKLLAGMGNNKEALGILQKAGEIAPGTMSRIRKLSSLAITTGQPEIAEKVMRETLQKHKHSPVRQANDYAVLSKALINQGKSEEALSVVQEAKKSFSDSHSSIVLSATESIAHRAAGNDALAQEVLVKTMSQGNIESMPADAVVAVADAYFALGKEEDAMRLLRHAVQNHQEDEDIKNKVLASLVAGGKEYTEASALIDASSQEVILLNNDGVRKAQAGQLEEAIQLLCEAANRLPNNLQIVGNAALAIALDLVRNGKNSNKLAMCMRYRESLIRQSPSHPKLEQIDSLLKQLKP